MFSTDTGEDIIVASTASMPSPLLATDYALEGNLRSEYGTKAPGAGNTTNSSSVETLVVQRHHPNDLLLAFGLLAIPVLIVCIIHSLLACRKIKRAKNQPHAIAAKSSSSHRNPANRDESVCVSSPPPQIRRTKSKSVTWQSPFETKARTSHRTSSQYAMPASELHFVMVATPEKTHTPVQQFLQNQRMRHSRALPPQQLMFTDDDEEEASPPHHLERLDSSLPLSDVSRTPSSLSLSPWPSSPPMLQDSGDYDSDSPRVSMSSVISDDPVLAQRTKEAMQACLQETRPSETQPADTVPTPPMPFLSRCSSSLDDFRHDLHHETTDEEDPDMITRSSEYSF